MSSVPNAANGCLLCGESAVHHIAYPGAAAPAARELGLEGIALCNTCGFGRAAPCPEQARLDDFYSSGSYWHASTNPYQMAHERVQATVRVQRIAPLMPATQGLRVLDVGAGHGFIAGALEDVGRVTAYDFIEPDDSAASHIVAGTRAFPRRRLSNLDEAANYDVLFLDHVLEHVADPEDFMRGLLGHLEPNALAYVETPLADQRFKSDVFPHVLFFTAPAIAALGKRLGAETIAIEAFGRMPGFALAHKFADVAFRAAVRSGMFVVQEAIDRAIWGYRVARDGVWLRWIFSKGSASG